MAERFNQTVNLRQVQTKTGAASGLMSLADRLDFFKQEALNVAEAQAAKRGATKAGEVVLAKGEEGITQAPEYKKEFILGEVEAKAYNNALRTSYIASLDNDNRARIAEISAENPSDVIGFNEKIDAYRSAVIKNVDPAIRQAVAIDLDGKIAAARNKIQVAEIAKNREAAMGNAELNLQSLTDDAVLAAREGDLTASASLLVDAFTNIDSQVESGFMSVLEAENRKRSIEIAATTSNLIGEIKRKSASGDHIGALKDIRTLDEKESLKGFSLKEKDDLVSAALTEVNESISLNDKIEDEEKKYIKEGQISTEQSLYSGIISGKTTPRMIISAAEDGKITESQRNNLMNTLNNRGRGVDDWGLVRTIKSAIERGEDVSQDIMSNAGVNLTEKTASDLLKLYQDKSDPKSIMNQQSVKEASSYITKKMRVVGPMGSLDTEAESRLADAEREFYDRVSAGENEWDVADGLVGKDQFIRAPEPLYGTKDDLNSSLAQLNESFDKGAINEETYNFEYGNLQRLMQLKQNIADFDKAKKDAANAKQ